MSDVEAVARTRDVLGEGPVFDRADGSLRWVDIGRKLWHRLDLVTAEVTSIRLDRALTGFAPTSSGLYIGAFAEGVALFDRDGQHHEWLHQPDAHLPDNRLNDAGTDPRGRFVLGSMNMAGSGPTGSLYALDADGGLSVLQTGIGITNTVAFSPDGTVLYTADSAVGALMAFRYDPDTGRLGERLESFRPEPTLPGTPDGSAVDAEGYLWNARWDGGCVVRLAPDGTTDRVVPLPARLVTSCCFVGTALYITTSTWEFGPDDHASQPLAGSLFRIDAGIEGLSRPAFEGLHAES